MKTSDRILYTVLAIMMAAPTLLFAISAVESRPMYSVNNSPPYGPPGGVTEGGVAFLGLILPPWLTASVLYAAFGAVFMVFIAIYGLLRLARGKSF